MFLLNLGGDNFSNVARKCLGLTPLFLYFKHSDIFTQILQKWPCQTPLVAGFRDMYGPTSTKNALLSLGQHHFSSKSRKFLGPTPPFLYLKNGDIFTQIEQKPACQTPVIAGFRHTYAPSSTKYLSTKSKTRWFQFFNQNIFRSHSPDFIFEKLVFSLNFSKNHFVRHLWWLISKTGMHPLPENMFLLSLRQDPFSN